MEMKKRPCASAKPRNVDTTGAYVWLLHGAELQVPGNIGYSKPWS